MEEREHLAFVEVQQPAARCGGHSLRWSVEEVTTGQEHMIGTVNAALHSDRIQLTIMHTFTYTKFTVYAYAHAHTGP